MNGGAAREDQFAEEWLQDWIDRKITDLSAVYEPPWSDAAPPGEEMSSSRIPGILDSVKRITVDLPEELYERLRLAAYTEHSSVSEVVRDRLAAALPAEKAETQ